MAKFMDEHGLADDSIASKPLKKMGSITKPMTPAGEGDLPGPHRRQLRALQESRPLGPQRFRRRTRRSWTTWLLARSITAEQAVKGNGLVDKIGFLEDAVDRAIELAQLDGEKVKVVRYKQEPGLSSMLLGEQSSRSEPLDLQGPAWR